MHKPHRYIYIFIEFFLLPRRKTLLSAGITAYSNSRVICRMTYNINIFKQILFTGFDYIFIALTKYILNTMLYVNK